MVRYCTVNLRSGPGRRISTGDPSERLTVLEHLKSIAVPVTLKRGGAAKAAAAAREATDPKVQWHRRQEPLPTVKAKLHRYHIGQQLRMVAGGRSWARPEGPCRVVALLPHDSGPFLYRIRSEAESFERVISEDDLTATEAT